MAIHRFALTPHLAFGSMRHPEDLPDVIGWLMALIAGIAAWGLFLLVLSSPWSHAVGLGTGAVLGVVIVRWWRSLNESPR